MIRREIERISGVKYRVMLIAAAALLVGGIVLFSFALRKSNVGGPGQAITSNAECPDGLKTGDAYWRDPTEQAHCLAHQETKLHIDTNIAGLDEDFVAAYADSSRLVILYIESYDPASASVPTFKSVVLQDGTTLRVEVSSYDHDITTQRNYEQVTFDTTSLPGNTTVLHVRSLIATDGNPTHSAVYPLDFTTPFHNTNFWRIP